MPTYYEILGCDKNATYEELKKCYHEQAKKHHPDKSDLKEPEYFLLLDKAWKTLRDQTTRREYDLIIAKNDLNEMPLYCEITLSEMTFESELDCYSYTCRCGGKYILDQSEMNDCENVHIACDECTFHIIVKLDKKSSATIV